MTDYASFAKVSGQIGRLLVTQLRFLLLGRGMSGSNTAISRRRLLQGAGAMWLLSVSQVSLAAVSQVVAGGGRPPSSRTPAAVGIKRQLR